MTLDADPYRTLGLTRGASLADVKRAYRRLAKANHPDAAGAVALPRFLAIHAAYQQIVDGAPAAGGAASPTTRRRPSSADGERADATRRAYGGRPRGPRPATGPDPAGAKPRGPAAGSTGTGDGAGRAGRRRSGEPSGGAAPGPDRAADAPGAAPGGTTKAGPARGKATLGSTSYDGADAGPFEPDWGGASWYGTTSGTYWTINPKEYADPRKHGPEYQARARRAASKPGAATREAHAEPVARPDTAAQSAPTHTTSSWWESTSGAETRDDPDAQDRPEPATAFDPDRTFDDARAIDLDGPAPDPARAALDLARALTDPRSGGVRGRAVRAFLGWLPIALGVGWLIGELTGCGRFAATCDPSVAPLTSAGQAIVLAGLFLVPEIAAIAAGAALVLLAAATAATVILSTTGTAADEGSRQVALGALLVVAWLSGLGIATVRKVRARAGVRPGRPVS